MCGQYLRIITVQIHTNSCPPYCGQYLRESGQLFKPIGTVDRRIVGSIYEKAVNCSYRSEQLSVVLWAVSTRKRTTVQTYRKSWPPYCGQYLRESGQLFKPIGTVVRRIVGSIYEKADNWNLINIKKQKTKKKNNLYVWVSHVRWILC